MFFIKGWRKELMVVFCWLHLCYEPWLAGRPSVLSPSAASTSACTSAVSPLRKPSAPGPSRHSATSASPHPQSSDSPHSASSSVSSLPTSSGAGCPPRSSSGFSSMPQSPSLYRNVLAETQPPRTSSFDYHKQQFYKSVRVEVTPSSMSRSFHVARDLHNRSYASQHSFYRDRDETDEFASNPSLVTLRELADYDECKSTISSASTSKLIMEGGRHHRSHGRTHDIRSFLRSPGLQKGIELFCKEENQHLWVAGQTSLFYYPTCIN